MNKQEIQTKTQTQTMVWLSERRGWIVKGKGVKYVETEDDLSLSGMHTMQPTDQVSEMYTWNLYNGINQCHLDNII